MNYKRILFVEDEASQRDLFQTAVNDWNNKNSGNGRVFRADFATTPEEGREKIEESRYDGALFDLRIGTKGKGERAKAAGNDLARAALFDRGIPVAIMTADDTRLEDDLRDAGALKVFDKNAEHTAVGNVYDQGIAWFGEQWDMMDALAASRRIMEGSAADIFVRRLWPRWKTFAELKRTDREELVKIVTRQYVGHIAERLGLDDPENASWHPFENYVSPSLMSHRAHTGDIFKFDDGLWVVLTPQCDMATKKVENVILAKCVRGISEWAQNVEALRVAQSNNQRREPTRFLQQFVNQNIAPSKHFLPPLPDENEPLLVHFSALRTEAMIKLNEDLTSRIASTSSPFLANLVQRFGAYISRAGQPNIDVSRF